MAYFLLPLDFRITFNVFHGINVFSAFLAIFLLAMYQMSHRNRLLRSACFVCFLMNGILAFNWLRGDAHLKGGAGCQLQAVVLNYCYIALHAHFCFFMINSCYAALSWSFFGTKTSEARTTLFILISWLIPMLPTLFAIWRFLGDRKPKVLARHFYCVISSPSWPLFRLWFFAFSIPGLFFSFYLLYRTWRYRRTTLNLSKTTQIDKWELFRLNLAIVLYIFLIGLSLGRTGKSEKATPKYNVPAAFNPYINHAFCQVCDSREYFCGRLCPGFKSYLPVLVGCILFLMYGFGGIAFRCYRRVCSYALRKFGFDGAAAKLINDSRRSSQATTATAATTIATTKRRYSTLASNNANASSLAPNFLNQRSSLPAISLSAPFGSLTDVHPNLSFSMPTPTSAATVTVHSSSSHSQSHSPALPSIEEDLETLFMSANNSRPQFKRQLHRRFSEPSRSLTSPNISSLLTISTAPISEHSLDDDEKDVNGVVSNRNNNSNTDSCSGVSNNCNGATTSGFNIYTEE